MKASRLFLLCSLLSAVSAQAQFQWSERIASTTTLPSNELAIGMALDNQGNCFVTGFFDGTNNFGGVTLTNGSAGGSDIFVAGYNSSGALLWVDRAGGKAGSTNVGRGLGVDNAGNVYVTGGFYGPADFGNTNLPGLSGFEEAFLAKYNNSGTLQWVRQSGGGGGVYGIGLAVDGAGNSYTLVFGNAQGASLTFGTTNVAVPANYGESTFLVKYDNSGSVQWAQLLGGSRETFATKIAVDAAGSVYVRGTFYSTLNIGTTNLTVNAGSQENMFIAKFAASGALTWVRQAQGGNVDEGGVAVDQAGNVYVSGSFETNVNFGGVSLTNAGSFDAFLAKYNSSGAVLWAVQNGGGTTSNANVGWFLDLALDSQGNVYTAGFLSTNAIPATGSPVATVAEYNSSGVPLWIDQALGAPVKPVASLVSKCSVDSSGNCYLVGLYQGAANFGSNVLQPQQTWNFFIAKTVNTNSSGSPLVVTTASVPNDTNGVAYTQTLTASGGKTPYNWTIVSGTLPAGLTLANNGVISGTPSSSGASTFTVQVIDAGALTATQKLTLTVFGPPTIVAIQPTNNSISLPIGSKVSFSVSVAGSGPFSYQWQLNGTNLPKGVITTVAGGGSAFPGDGGAATNAELAPLGLAVDANGNLFIADGFYRIRKVGTNGIITTVAGNGTYGYSGDGGVATNAELGIDGNFQLAGVAVDASGNLFVTDMSNRIRKVTTNGVITTVAGNGYVNSSTTHGGYSGDGGKATNAELNLPFGVAVDATGNLFIADTYNSRIREVGTNGFIATAAGDGLTGFFGDGGAAINAALTPSGVTVDGTGNLFIAGNNRIRRVGTNGVITTVAGNGTSGYSGDGGAATNAELNEPFGTAVDGSGNLFIADTYNNRVRMVDSNGYCITVAGGGSNYPGDGGAATSAELVYPAGVALDASGNLFIAEEGNNRVRKIVFSGPTLALDNVSALNAGAYDVVVSNPFGSVTSSVVSLTVSSGSPLVVMTTSLPNGTNALAYNQALAASGGQIPYSWKTISGALPTGLTLAINGGIAGIPTANGTNNFIVQVTDAMAATATQALVLTVGAPPTIISIKPPQLLPTNTLVAYYPFSGNANDQTTNANNGTPYNVAVGTNRFGQPGHGYRFNGVNSYISAPNQHYLSFPEGQFSISVWAAIDGTSPNPTYLLGLDNGPGSQAKWLIPFGWIPGQLPDPSPGGYLSFSINDGLNAYYVPTVACNPPLSSWHQYVFTKTGSTYAIYIDGVLVSGTNVMIDSSYNLHTGIVGPSAIPSGITAPLTIGGAEGSGFFNGTLDDLRIYSSALSANEVARLYVAASTPLLGLEYVVQPPLSAVQPTLSNLTIGKVYQLQVSTNLTGTFTNYGSAFTATNSSIVYSQYFSVANWGPLFFRLKTSP